MLSGLNLIRLFVLFALLSPLLLVRRRLFFFFFLKFSGPSFLKLGQLLSARPDLVGDDLSRILSSFQDKIPPFSAKKVKKIVKNEFGDDFSRIFSDFDFIPVASASIAQVHKAKLAETGDLVAVKILRPGIRRAFNRDIRTLRLISFILRILRIRLSKVTSDLADLLAQTSKNETDLLLEAANASQLRENLKNIDGFFVPQIFWNLSTSRVLVLQWIDGVAFSDQESIRNKVKSLENSGKIKAEKIAQNFIISYFSQVYNDGFFHCDMHPGNLFLQNDGSIAVVDFGIMGNIDKKTRIAVAEILIGFLNRDYQNVAQLHIDAGLVPLETNVNDLAISCRKIGEMIVDVPVKDISMAKILLSLIEMTNRYGMDTRPDLLLLQKTLMLVEGVGTRIDPELNIWELAKPWMKNWAKTNIGFDAKLVDLASEFLRKLKQKLSGN